NNNCVKPSQPSPIPSPPTCSQDFITLSEEKNATLVVKCIDKNQTRNFTFSNFLLYNLTLKANFSIYNFIIRIQKIPESLIDQSIKLDKKVYYYLEFSRENLNEKNLAKIIARFKVEKSWVYSENINASTISLYRLTTSWEKLPTYKIDEDSSFLYFESELPGFSIFAIGGEEKVALPLPQCPICPESSEWSECKEGRRNRTSYYCSEETNFTCLQYTEEQECEEEKKEEEGLTLLYIGLALLAFVPIVLLILYLRKFFKPKKEIKLEKEVICPRCFLKMEKTYSGRNIEMYECKKCGYVRPEIKESYFEEET
ncbi:MAG: PGF-pre-PGF domain-containing protein, partial [Candidatus Aenigmatarchaeota archaeon]